MAQDYLDEEDLDPYSSISDREPLEDPTQGNMPSVKNYIAQRKGIDFNNDPLMKQYNAQQADVNAFRQNLANQQQDQLKNVAMGHIAAQLARGASAPEGGDSVANDIAAFNQQQNKQLTEGKESDLDRRQKILNAIEQRQGRMDVASQNAKARTDAASAQAQVRQQLQQDRLDAATHNRVINRLNTDKALGQRLVQYQNLDNAFSNFMSADITTPQQVDELQQAIRNNLGIKGSSGVGERESTYINTMGLKKARIMQLLSGDPQNVAKDSKLIGHFKDLVRLEQGNIKNQVNSRIGAVTSGNGSMYERRPDLKEDLMSAVDAQKAQYGSSEPNPSNPALASAPGMPGKPEAGAAYAAGGKNVVRKQYSPSRDATKITYDDGSEVIVNGKQ